MIGNDIHNFAKELWPINRSITGQGVRDTLELIKNYLPDLSIKSIPSGSRVFDWTIPKEWKVNHAYIIAPNGEKICDFSKNNLHLVNYSSPFFGKMDLEKIKKHLHTLPNQPNAIPYITSYYEENWGFCLTQTEFNKLEDGIYDVVVDTELFEGVLNFAELKIKGKSEKEILLTTNICHPSMANNELSGPCVVTFLAKRLIEIENPEYSYRVVFTPETIGSITYLSLNLEEMKKNTLAGFHVSCIGDARAYSYTQSRKGSTMSDLIAKHVLSSIDPSFFEYSWLERGTDDRQYCAPGVDLPLVAMTRSKSGEYPEYHTSLDDLENVVTPEGLNGGYWAVWHCLEAIERNKKYRVLVLCEPQLGKRGLYPKDSPNYLTTKATLMKDFISLCDGETSLLEIAERLSVPIWELYDIVSTLEMQQLISSEPQN